jgi:multidrug efflux pump
MQLSTICIQRPVLALVLNLLIILIGITAFFHLPIREYPKIDTPVISISTHLPGASMEVVEHQVTQILEEALAGLEGIDYLTSSTRAAQSYINLYYLPNYNIEAALNTVRDKISTVQSHLPEESTSPQIHKEDADSHPILWLALTNSQYSLMEMSRLIHAQLKDQLDMVPGVGRVAMLGQRTPAMHIELDNDKLAAYALTPQQIIQALKEQNLEIPSGSIQSSHKQWLIHTRSHLNTVNDFNQIILKQQEGFLLKLQDIAKVTIAPESTQFLARYTQQTAIGLGIIKQSTANPLTVAKHIKALIPKLKANLPPEIELEVAYDATKIIEHSIHAVYQTLIEAILLVALVMCLFLKSLRAALIPIVTIPVALIGSLGLLWWLNYSLNTLTLLALVLSIGLVVDDAIIVLENIVRHIEKGLSPFHAAVKGMQEIGFAVVAMTLTLVAVFVPITFTEGEIGRLFTEFAVVLAGAVLISGFTALTLSPMMCAQLLKAPKAPLKPSRKFQFGLRLTQALSRYYATSLRWALRHPITIVGLLGLILVGNGWLFSNLPSQLTPDEDRSHFIVWGHGPSDATFDYIHPYAQKIEQLLSDTPEVTGYFMGIGYPNSRQVFALALLKPKAQRHTSQQAIVKAFSEKLTSMTGINVFAYNPASSLGDDSNPGEVNLVLQYPGPYAELATFAEKIKNKLEQNPQLNQVDLNLKNNKPQIEVNIDREQAALMGIGLKDIAQTLQVLFAGYEVDKFEYFGKRYPVYLTASDAFRSRINHLEQVALRAENGDMVKLANLITPSLSTVAMSRFHFNRLPALQLNVSLNDDYPMQQALLDIQQTIDTITEHKVQTDYTDATRLFIQSHHTLLWLFSLALLVIFLVLAAQFESFYDPFIILLTVPLAIGGALVVLYGSQGSLNIFSQIGLITLIGLITKHGILIVEFANTLRQHYPLQEAIYQATLQRVRPIIMTTVATVLGALPLALAKGPGAEARQEIGWVIVGGMSLGTLMTLLILPVIYHLFQQLRRTLRHS